MLDEVCVRPMPKAGGSFATAVYDRMSDPVMVEHVKAHAGMDIGCTLIGMHLKDVAVPLRLSVKKIGDALVTAAYTRRSKGALSRIKLSRHWTWANALFFPNLRF